MIDKNPKKQKHFWENVFPSYIVFPIARRGSMKGKEVREIFHDLENEEWEERIRGKTYHPKEIDKPIARCLSFSLSLWHRAHRIYTGEEKNPLFLVEAYKGKISKLIIIHTTLKEIKRTIAPLLTGQEGAMRKRLKGGRWFKNLWEKEFYPWLFKEKTPPKLPFSLRAGGERIVLYHRLLLVSPLIPRGRKGDQTLLLFQRKKEIEKELQPLIETGDYVFKIILDFSFLPFNFSNLFFGGTYIPLPHGFPLLVEFYQRKICFSKIEEIIDPSFSPLLSFWKKPHYADLLPLCIQIYYARVKFERNKEREKKKAKGKYEKLPNLFKTKIEENENFYTLVFPLEEIQNCVMTAFPEGKTLWKLSMTYIIYASLLIEKMAQEIGFPLPTPQMKGLYTTQEGEEIFHVIPEIDKKEKTFFLHYPKTPSIT